MAEFQIHPRVTVIFKRSGKRDFRDDTTESKLVPNGLSDLADYQVPRRSVFHIDGWRFGNPKALAETAEYKLCVKLAAAHYALSNHEKNGFHVQQFTVEELFADGTLEVAG